MDFTLGASVRTRKLDRAHSSEGLASPECIAASGKDGGAGSPRRAGFAVQAGIDELGFEIIEGAT